MIILNENKDENNNSTPVKDVTIVKSNEGVAPPVISSSELPQSKELPKDKLKMEAILSNVEKPEEEVKIYRIIKPAHASVRKRSSRTFMEVAWLLHSGDTPGPILLGLSVPCNDIRYSCYASVLRCAMLHRAMPLHVMPCHARCYAMLRYAIDLFCSVLFCSAMLGYATLSICSAQI